MSGIVVDANGVPAPGVILFVHGVDVDQPDKSTATDENGRFVFKRICKGLVRIQVNFPNRPGGAGHLTAEAETQDLRAVLGQDIVHLNYKSLNEKPLPKLKDLGIELSSEDLNAKMLVVCFFDMQQRPSRYCVNQLVKQTDQLKAKDIVVVIVHASKINENKLNDWVKKYNIPLKVGMIESKEEKIRFTWGVRSLPWLILTDKKHIVRAEGFNLSELDEKIKEIVP
ncbi:MAG: redoxin domain-containing protein [Sedimentisphaerales bacterium]|nr:redoxin domain-containing protein [Sedimentisphaerales bacterium]